MTYRQKSSYRSSADNRTSRWLKGHAAQKASDTKKPSALLDSERDAYGYMGFTDQS